MQVPGQKRKRLTELDSTKFPQEALEDADIRSEIASDSDVGALIGMLNKKHRIVHVDDSVLALDKCINQNKLRECAAKFNCEERMSWQCAVITSYNDEPFKSALSMEAAHKLLSGELLTESKLRLGAINLDFSTYSEELSKFDIFIITSFLTYCETKVNRVNLVGIKYPINVELPIIVQGLSFNNSSDDVFLKTATVNPHIHGHLKALSIDVRQPRFMNNGIWEFIRTCSNLTELNLTWCENCHAHVSSLAKLPNLKSLSMIRARITNDTVLALSALHNLQSLSLQGNPQITDVSALAKLTSLHSLDLRLCQVTNLLPLENLTSLKVLRLDNTKNTDATLVILCTSLKSLQTLEISGHDLSDVSPLAKLTSLQSLDLSGNGTITDASPLTALRNLTFLNLSRNTRITNLSVLAGLHKLETLDLSECNQVTDWVALALANLRSLTSLNLMRTNITNLSLLAGLHKLKTLDLSGCIQITDMSQLIALRNLTSLKLSNNGVNLLSLAGLHELKTLDLSECGKVTDGDIVALAKLRSLTSLNLMRTDITKVSPLAQCTLLRKLNLKMCGGIVDLQRLMRQSPKLQLEL